MGKKETREQPTKRSIRLALNVWGDGGNGDGGGGGVCIYNFAYTCIEVDASSQV